MAGSSGMKSTRQLTQGCFWRRWAMVVSRDVFEAPGAVWVCKSAQPIWATHAQSNHIPGMPDLLAGSRLSANRLVVHPPTKATPTTHVFANGLGKRARIMSVRLLWLFISPLSKVSSVGRRAYARGCPSAPNGVNQRQKCRRVGLASDRHGAVLNKGSTKPFVSPRIGPHRHKCRRSSALSCNTGAVKPVAMPCVTSPAWPERRNANHGRGPAQRLCVARGHRCGDLVLLDH